MEWMKLFTAKWLYGSGRNMTPEKRGVWVDLLALAAESKLRDGILRFDIGQPMPRDYICAILRIDKELLDICINCFVRDLNADDGQGRIKIWDDGTIQITNWDKFQDNSDKVMAKKRAKEVSIDRARQTRKKVDTAADALLRSTNILNGLVSKIISDKIPVECPFCPKNFNDSTDLARHIYQSDNDGHIEGKEWAKKFLHIDE